MGDVAMNNTTQNKAGGKARKVIKRVCVTAFAVLVLVTAADIGWSGSGSNTWNVVSDADGIRVATLKTPGYSLYKYKVNMHVDARLSDVVYYLSSTTTGDDVGAKDVARLEAVSSEKVSYVYDTYKLDLPAPFGRADVVLINTQVQDPVSKTVKVNIFAAPNKKPVDPSIPRVEHLSNTWTLTPLASGGVDIESVSEFDLGLPALLANTAMPAVMADESSKMRALLRKDKYRNKTLAHITELNTGTSLSALSGQTTEQR
jgi:hypothetical protein